MKHRHRVAIAPRRIGGIAALLPQAQQTTQGSRRRCGVVYSLLRSNRLFTTAMSRPSTARVGRILRRCPRSPVAE